MSDLIWELLALTAGMTTVLLAMVRALRSASATNSLLADTLRDFGETLRAHNRERESWGHERETLKNELEKLRGEARERQALLAAEIARLKTERQQERAARQALEKQVQALQEELSQERAARQALEKQVQALQEELSQERAARQKAERDKEAVAAERDDIRQQLESLRQALENKADKQGKSEQQTGERSDETDVATMGRTGDCGWNVADGAADTGVHSVAKQTSCQPGEQPVDDVKGAAEQNLGTG